MKTKPQLSRQQMLAVGLACFGLVLGLGSYLTLVAPQKSKAVALSGAVEAAQSSLFVVQHNPHVTTRRPKPPAVEAADLFRLTKAMPDSDDIPGILLTLMRLAQASSLQLMSVQPGTDAISPSGFTTIPLSVTLDGKFDDVAGFLQRLRDSVVESHNKLKVTSRLFIPTDISLTTDPDGSNVDASISLDAFVYGVAAPPPAPASTTDTTTTDTTTTSSSS